MESIVQVVQGDQLNIENKQCIFCNNAAESIFAITKSKKHNGTLITCFPVCKDHRARLNALLSGEFDIDQIYLEQFRSNNIRKINVRRIPPLAKTNNRKSWQICSFIGCTNRYYGIKNQKYCTDPRCKELRTNREKLRKKTKIIDSDAKNIILEKSRYSKHLIKGQALKIRCRARNAHNERCRNTFLITFDPKQNTYPMFCECHRSAYKRLRYQERI